MSEFGPIIYDGIEEPSYGDFKDAPPEMIVEQVGRGNVEAWRALLERVGTNEKEFVEDVAEEILLEIDKYIAEKKKNDSTGTVE
jgi:hypothetical protein